MRWTGWTIPLGLGVGIITDMPRKPEGLRPLTPAERQARQRQRRAERRDRMETALRVIAATCRGKAQAIAMDALKAEGLDRVERVIKDLASSDD